MAFDTKHPHSFVDRERSSPEDGVSSADLDAPGATHQDAVDMLRLGKKQEFKRNFNFWSTLGFISIYMATWEFVLVSLALGLWNGGFGGRVPTRKSACWSLTELTGLFWTFIVTVLCYSTIVVSLAEMESMVRITLRCCSTF